MGGRGVGRGRLGLFCRPSEDRLPTDSHGACQVALPERTTDQPAKRSNFAASSRFILSSLELPITGQPSRRLIRQSQQWTSLCNLTPERDYRTFLLRHCNAASKPQAKSL